MSGAKLIGLAEAKKQLRRLADKIDLFTVSETLLKGAQACESEVLKRTPLGETGNLRRGVHSGILKNKRRYGPGAFVAVDYNIAPHCYLVEYGHGGSKPAGPTPFFRPGIRAGRRKAKQKIVPGLKKVFKRV